MRDVVAAALAGAAVVAATTSTQAADMPKSAKAYVIGEVNVTDPQTYKSYAEKTSPIVAKFGGIYIARGGQTVPVEGVGPAGRIVVIEFPSLAAAKAFEASAEYLKVAPIRQRSSTGRFFIVEGTPP